MKEEIVMKIFVNLLTTGRLVIALLLPFIKNKIFNNFFIGSIIIIFLTDFIDGKLARKYNIQTFFGSYMDTLANKVLNIILLIMLSDKSKMSLIMLILEISILIINSIGWILKKKTKSSILGRAKMWAIGITITLEYMNYFNIINIDVNHIIVNLFIIITTIMQILVIVDYVIKFIKDDNKRLNIKLKSWKDLAYILFNTDYYNSVNQNKIQEI